MNIRTFSSSWVSFTFLFSAFLAAPHATAADRVVLKSGEVLEGRILTEENGTVSIQSGDGIVTVLASNVRSIDRDREPSVTRTPNRARERGSTAARLERGQLRRSPPRSPGGPASALRLKLDRTLEEIEANELGTWVAGPREGASGASLPYRVLRDDSELYEYVERLPRTSEGVREAWTRRADLPANARAGLGVPRKATSYVWVRIHWDDRSERWTLSHPNESRLRWEDSQIRTALRRIAKKSDAAKAARIERLVGSLRRARSLREEADLHRELRVLTREVSEPWSDGDLYYDVILSSERIREVARVEQKVEIARERRVLFRELVAAVP